MPFEIKAVLPDFNLDNTTVHFEKVV